MSLALDYGRTATNPITRYRPSRVQTNVSVNNMDPVVANALIALATEATDVEQSVEYSDWGILWTEAVLDDSYPRTAVEAVEYIRSILRCTLEEVLVAAGVAPRTYHGWSSDSRVPRASSQGQIWQIANTLQLMQDVNPNLTAWFQSSEKAKEIFVRGDLQGLVKYELMCRIRQSRTSKAYVFSDDSIFNE